MGPFESFYASAWQHPWLLWAAALLAGGWCLRERGLHSSVRRYCVALTVLSLADAWLTSNDVYGIGVLTGTAATVVPLFFVLAGDFRYLVLLGVARPEGTLRWAPGPVVVALALTLVVPGLSQVVVSLLPEGSSSPRVLFLVYEVAFFVLTAGILAFHSSIRRVAWLRPVSLFVLSYYALWAIADTILLATGSDLGFALRVVPNVLYYGVMIAVIGRAAAGARGVE